MTKKVLIVLSFFAVSLYVWGENGASANARMLQPNSGETVYKENCASCHDKGIGGAPKTGDKSAWAPRIKQGMETLTKKAVEGYKGTAGEMPAKGGNQKLTDKEVGEAVTYMVDASK